MVGRWSFLLKWFLFRGHSFIFGGSVKSWDDFTSGVFSVANCWARVCSSHECQPGLFGTWLIVPRSRCYCMYYLNFEVGRFHQTITSKNKNPSNKRIRCNWNLKMAQVHPQKLTWNLKMDPRKRRYLLETIIFRFHVSFCGGVIKKKTGSFPNLEVVCCCFFRFQTFNFGGFTSWSVSPRMISPNSCWCADGWLFQLCRILQKWRDFPVSPGFSCWIIKWGQRFRAILKWSNSLFFHETLTHRP